MNSWMDSSLHALFPKSENAWFKETFQQSKYMRRSRKPEELAFRLHCTTPASWLIVTRLQDTKGYNYLAFIMYFRSCCHTKFCDCSRHWHNLRVYIFEVQLVQFQVKYCKNRPLEFNQLSIVWAVPLSSSVSSSRLVPADIAPLTCCGTSSIAGGDVGGNWQGNRLSAGECWSPISECWRTEESLKPKKKYDRNSTGTMFSELSSNIPRTLRRSSALLIASSHCALQTTQPKRIVAVLCQVTSLAWAKS